MRSAFQVLAVTSTAATSPLRLLTPNGALSLGGITVVLTTHLLEEAEKADRIEEKFACSPMVVDGTVRLEQPDGHQWIARLVDAFPDRIEAITLGKPTLEDVFIHATGHRFWSDGAGESGA